MEQAGLLPCYLKIIMFHGDKWIQLTMKVKYLAGRGATVSDFSAWQKQRAARGMFKERHMHRVAGDACQVDTCTDSQVSFWGA